MFAKLLKYEWKSTAGTLGILSLAALGVGVLGAVVVRLMFQMDSVITDDGESTGLILAALGAILVFLILALVAYVFASEILLLVRFYKNKFTDEGYLTFTLPVNSHQIFLSSWLNILAWTVITFAVVVISVLIAILFGAGGENLVYWDFFSDAGAAIREAMALSTDEKVMLLLSLLLAIVGLLYTPVLIMTCVTVGATIAKKHKILVAFGIYYGVNMVIGIATSVINVAYMMAEFAVMETVSVNGTYISQIILQIALGVGGYFLSTYLMRRKLNLP